MTLPPYGEQPQQEYQPYGALPSGIPPYGGPPLYQQPKPTSGLAIASMVVSLVAAFGAFALCGVGGIFGIAGAIMGHVSRGQIKREQQSGDGFAIAGIVVGWITFAIAIIAIVVIVIFIIVAGHSPDPYDTGTSV